MKLQKQVYTLILKTKVANSQDDDIKKKYETARDNIISAWKGLWEDTVDELDTAALAKQLKDADNAITSLSDHFKTLRTKGPKGRTVSTATITIAGALDDLPEKQEERIKVVQKALLLGDRSLVWIALVVALITGLTELYYSKNFGTISDWLSALTWGFGTKAALEVLTAAWEKLFPKG